MQMPMCAFKNKILIAMKMTKIVQAFIIVCILLTCAACVQDDDFAVPDLTATDPILDGPLITIGALKNSYDQAVMVQMNNLGIDSNDADGIAQLRRNYSLDLSETNQYIEGFVISSDEGGNWFEEIIIQDHPSAPTAGVRVLIDESPLFTSYDLGSKVVVRLGATTLDGIPLSGLHVGDSNGVLTLGFTEDLDKIPAPAQFNYVQRTSVVEELVPLVTSISSFSEALENLYIQLPDVQFVKEDVISVGLTYAGEPLDEFDGERTLLSCIDERKTILSTSTFASFKSILLPTGRGSVTGVLTRNFFGEDFNLVINDPSAIIFEDIERCDPIELDCGTAETAGTNILFQDLLESQIPNTLITGNGWINYQQAGSEKWEAYNSEGQNASLGTSARVGSFLSGDAATVAWLITPEVDFSAQNGETLSFKTSHSFLDNCRLEVLFTSDWNGNENSIASATWEVIAAARIADEDDFFGDWINSGLVDLSCLNVAGHVAFRYTGSGDPDFDGSFELDEIVIRSE